MQIDARLVRLRFPDYCFICARELERGDHAWWHDQRRFVTCAACLARESTDDLNPPDLRSPLGWAHDILKYERMRERKREEQRELELLSRIGSEVWDISAERPSTAIWRNGSATGQRIVGKVLDGLVPRGIVVLHDVRLRAERRHIDHVVITRSGVHIIVSEQQLAKRIDIQRTGPLLARSTRLLIGGQDHTELAEEMHHQVEKIEQLIGGTSGGMLTSVTPALCFVHANWGWPRRRLAIGDIEILWPKALMTLLSRPGPLQRPEIEELGGRLASRLVYDE